MEGGDGAGLAGLAALGEADFQAAAELGPMYTQSVGPMNRHAIYKVQYEKD
jgi:hypothetical protein